MNESFFEGPILNSPYAHPDRHWELDDAANRRTRSSRSLRRRADVCGDDAEMGTYGMSVLLIAANASRCLAALR
jgi:hypothetical protein